LYTNNIVVTKEKVHKKNRIKKKLKILILILKQFYVNG